MGARVKPYTIGDWTIRGVDDWLCFITDPDGRWHYLVTECDGAWRDVLRAQGKLAQTVAGLDLDPWTDEGVLIVAVLMIKRGDVPRPIETLGGDEETIADLERAFGAAPFVTWCRSPDDPDCVLIEYGGDIPRCSDSDLLVVGAFA